MSRGGFDHGTPVCVVCEAEFDFLVVRELFERVARESVDWLDGHELDDFFHFCSDEARPFYMWSRVGQLGEKLPFRKQGRVSEGPGAVAAKRAVNLVISQHSALRDRGIILLVLDADKRPDREEGLKAAQAANAFLRERVVVGCANSKIECWCLCCLEDSDVPADRLAAVRRNLGYNPLQKAHELTARQNDNKAKHVAKKVLADLLGDDVDAYRAGIASMPLRRMREKGTEVSIASFVAELSQALNSWKKRPG